MLPHSRPVLFMPHHRASPHRTPRYPLFQEYHRRCRYVSTTDPETWVKPKDVLKEFYSENAEYMNTLRDVYREVHAKEPDGFDLIRWNTAKNYYLHFLQEQYEYATSLELDRDAYFRPD